MPIMGGIEATKEIFGHFPVTEIPPIVALTANDFDTDRKSCLDVGMVDYLIKP